MTRPKGATRVEFRVLGLIEALAGGEPVPLGGTKRKALLAVLLLSAGRAVSIDELTDALWPAGPPPTAEHSLQVYVSQLRKALGLSSAERRVLVTEPPGYAVRVDAEAIDRTRFERLVDEGDRARAAGERALACERYRAALDLWRGRALADVCGVPALNVAAALLEERRLSTLEERIELDLELGRHAQLVGELSGLVRLEPLRERLRGQLILALYRCGRQAEALGVYRETRRMLVEEYGIEPSRALRRLEQLILRQDDELERSALTAVAGTPS